MSGVTCEILTKSRQPNNNANLFAQNLSRSKTAKNDGILDFLGSRIVKIQREIEWHENNVENCDVKAPLDGHLSLSVANTIGQTNNIL